jgi:hypothetical protein
MSASANAPSATVGVLNNSSSPVQSLPLSGSDIFGYSTTATLRSAGMPLGV